MPKKPEREDNGMLPELELGGDNADAAGAVKWLPLSTMTARSDKEQIRRAAQKAADGDEAASLHQVVESGVESSVDLEEEVKLSHDNLGESDIEIAFQAIAFTVGL